MNHLIDILQLSTQEIDELVEKAKDIIANPKAYAHKCDGKILATLFFEPSTRTRLSFESAMLSLGSTSPEGQSYPMHHPKVVFDEGSFVYGTAAYVQIALSYLNNWDSSDK